MYDMNVHAFRSWLQSCDPQEVVGWAAQETACPVARWMHELYQLDFHVSGNVVTVDGAVCSSFCPPLWVLAFEIELDGRYDCHPASVSAAEALRVLDDVLL